MTRGSCEGEEVVGRGTRSPPMAIGNIGGEPSWGYDIIKHRDTTTRLLFSKVGPGFDAV